MTNTKTLNANSFFHAVHLIHMENLSSFAERYKTTSAVAAA